MRFAFTPLSVQRVTENIAADDLLTTFRQNKQHIAVVEDAFEVWPVW